MRTARRSDTAAPKSETISAADLAKFDTFVDFLTLPAYELID